MAKNEHRDEWLRDLNNRQRNVVFPDTAQNEARFWRNIIVKNQKLNAVQVLSLVLIALTLLVAAAVMTSSNWLPEQSWPEKLRSAALTWGVTVAFIGGLLLLIKWGTRKR